jgi:hypothetical protein
MKVCPECGAEVAPEMRFCAECGTRVEVGQSTVSYAPSFGEEVEATGGGADGAARRMHDLAEEVVTVGRGQESDIFLDDVTVSRKHAEIVRGDGGYRIRDVGSLNGTYVNRVRVDAVDLRNGDEIQVGKYRFRFVFS